MANSTNNTSAANNNTDNSIMTTVNFGEIAKGNTKPEAKYPRFVFKVSRYRETINQLLFAERFKKNAGYDENPVKSMGRLMVDLGFISGLHLAYITPEGEVIFSWDKLSKEEDEELGGIRQNLNISLPESLVEKLIHEVKQIPAICKPQLDKNGVSILRDYQVHVILTDSNAENYFKEDGSAVFKFAAEQVVALELVDSSSEHFVDPSPTTTVDFGLIAKAQQKAQVEEEPIEAPTDVESAKTYLKLSRAQKRRLYGKQKLKDQQSRDMSKYNPESEAQVELDEEEVL